MLTLRSKIRNLLKEPYTSREVAEILNLKPNNVNSVIWYLLKSGKVIVHSTIIKGTKMKINKYQATDLDEYEVCKRCGERILSALLSRKVCPTCKSYNSYDVPEFYASPVIITHMQTIINEQKQQIYNLVGENYMLKRSLKSLKLEFDEYIQRNTIQ